METSEDDRIGRVVPLMRVVVLALLITSCSALGGREVDAVGTAITAADGTRVELDRAVAIATGSGQTMSAEARQALTAAETALITFNESMEDIAASPELSQEAESFAQSAKLALDLLGEGNVDVAAEVATAQVAGKHATVSAALRARLNELGGPDQGGSPVPMVVGALIVAALAALALPKLRPSPKAQDTAPERPKAPEVGGFASSFPEDPISSLTSSLPPIGSEPPKPVEPTGPIRNPEAAHSVRGGLRTVELEGIIDAALATVTNTGWEVAIQCPPVRVLVDPLRMRRLLSNLLLSATAHGAEHIGLVAEIVGDKVEVNVGHDGDLLVGAAEEAHVPPEVEHQLTVAKQLLVGMHADVRWTRWRGVSLYTVELVRGPEEIDAPGRLAEVGG